MEEGYIGQFRGIPVIVKPNAEITEIILPESLAAYILQLQDDKIKYLQKELDQFFLTGRTSRSQLNN